MWILKIHARGTVSVVMVIVKIKTSKVTLGLNENNVRNTPVSENTSETKRRKRIPMDCQISCQTCGAEYLREAPAQTKCSDCKSDNPIADNKEGQFCSIKQLVICSAAYKIQQTASKQVCYSDPAVDDFECVGLFIPN